MEQFLTYIAESMIYDINFYSEQSTLWWIFVSLGYTIFLIVKYTIITCPFWIPLKLILAELNPNNKKPLVYKVESKK
jgi:hypothetical protein